MLISFLIVNYFTSYMVSDLVKSINYYIKKYDYEILIFDNSNDINEYNTLQRNISVNCRTYSIQKNIGFVKANNYLFDKANGEMLILINPDTYLIDDSLESLIEFMMSDREIAIAGPKLLNKDYSYQVSFFKFPNLKLLFYELILLKKNNVYAYNTNINDIQDCNVIQGACLCVKREYLNGENIFCEDYEMYSEETDLCKQIIRQNLRVVYFPKASIIHHGGQSTKNDSIGAYALFNYFKSKIIYSRKYFSKLEFLLTKSMILFSLLERTIIMLFLLKFSKAKIFVITLIKLL